MIATPDVHLVVLIHGLWGKPFHLNEAKEALEAAWADITTTDSDMADSVSSTSPAPGKRDELVVVVAEGMTAQLTYDGVDVCASRVAWEVDQQISRLEASGRRVSKFSVLGYSLGGLVARYLLGLLDARSPSFFDQHVPVSFTTVATPHLGIPRYNTLLSTALGWLGGRLMSRTGEQIHVVDSYSSSDPRPLLEIMADPKKVFHKALHRFRHVHIFANVVNDVTVPYPSAAIETEDPFVMWSERGLIVEADDIGMVSKWEVPEVAPRKRKNIAWRLGTLPPVLRFRWPFNYLIIALFPILVPIITLLIVIRFSLDTNRSRIRLQRLARTAVHSSGTTSPRSEAASPESPSSPASPIPSALGLSIDGLRAVIREVERSFEQDLIHAADHADATDIGRTDTLSVHEDTGKEYDDDVKDPPIPQPKPLLKAILNDQQLRMVHWLNALDPVKHLVWFPEVANSHAVIIARDPAHFPVHARGRAVLKIWAETVTREADEARAF